MEAKGFGDGPEWSELVAGLESDGVGTAVEAPTDTRIRLVLAADDEAIRSVADLYFLLAHNSQVGILDEEEAHNAIAFGAYVSALGDLDAAVFLATHVDYEELGAHKVAVLNFPAEGSHG